MNKSTEASSCYPANYDFNNKQLGEFNLNKCKKIYNNLIKNNDIEKDLIPYLNQKFIVYTGIYYIFHFFNVDSTQDQGLLEWRMQSICTETWRQLQKDYPTESLSYLFSYCANGVFRDALLFNTLSFK